MLVAVDSETFLISPTVPIPHPVCWSFAWEDGSQKLLLADEGLELLATLLKSQTVVFHSADFDLCVAAFARPSLFPVIFDALRAGRICCTKIREQLLDIAAGRQGVGGKDDGESRYIVWDGKAWIPKTYHLASLSYKYLGKDRSAEKDDPNSVRLRYSEVAGMPVVQWPDAFRDYALEDAHDTLQICSAQGGSVQNEAAQVAADFAFRLGAARGLQVDERVVDHLEQTCRDKQDRIRGKLFKLGYYRFEGPQKDPCRKVVKDTKFLQARVEKAFRRHGLTPPRTEKGAIKTDADTLELSRAPVLQLMAEAGPSATVLKTFVPALKKARDGGGILHPKPNCLVNSGRPSMREPNLLNLPRGLGVREAFTARPGYWLCSVDYDCAELRSWAQVCFKLFGWSDLRDFFVKDPNGDPHLALAASVLRVPIEQADKRDPKVKGARQMCFHPDTECLTRTGWKRIADLSGGEEVIQATPGAEGCALQWARPLDLQRMPNPSGRLVHLKNMGMDLRVTPDHRMLCFNLAGAPAECLPAEVEKKRGWWGAGKLPGGTWNPDLRLLKLAVATQADGSYTDGHISFGFAKRRKVERLLALLEPDEFSRSERQPTNVRHGRVYTIRLRVGLSRHIKELLTPHKCLDWRWLELSEERRRLVVEEARFWDGCQMGNWKHYSYSTTQKINADVLSALASSVGRKTRLITRVPQNPKARPVHVLSVKTHAETRGGNLSREELTHFGEVVCLTVPSSYLLVRDGGIPVITGNCKSLNFGLPGGMGPARLAESARKGYGVIMSEREAAERREQFAQRWREYRPYLKYISRLTQNGDATITQMFSGRKRGGCGFTDGANTYFQGLTADGAKRALVNVTEECYAKPDSPLYGSRPLLLLYDEILAEVPIAQAHEAAHRLAEVMCSSMREYLPDVPVTASPALMTRWIKGAEPRFDAANRLIPWDLAQAP